MAWRPKTRKSLLVIIGVMLCASSPANADQPYSPKLLDNVLTYLQHPLNSGLLYDVGPESCNIVIEKALQAHSAVGLQTATLHYLAGCCYYFGSGTQKSAQAAISHFTRASELGLAKATSALGMMHDYGIGVEEDKARAMSFYSEAAADGEPYAAGQLAFHEVMQDIASQDESRNNAR